MSPSFLRLSGLDLAPGNGLDLVPVVLLALTPDLTLTEPGPAGSSPRMMVDSEIAKLCFGMVAGSVSTVMLLPVDQVKTAIQINAGDQAGDSDDASEGMCVATYLKNVVAENGIKGLFKGAKPAVTGGAPEAGIQFAVHDWSLAAFSALWAANIVHMGVPLDSVDAGLAHNVVMSAGDAAAGLGDQVASLGLEDRSASVDAEGAQLIANALLMQALPPPPNVALNAAAGGLSGFCQVVATCPMEVMKQRAMLDDKRTKVSLTDLFHGMNATWLRDIPFSAIYFSLASYLHAAALASGGNKVVATVFSGLAAGAISSFVTTPFDVIKTRIQCEEEVKYCISDMAKIIYKEDGLAGFFSGGTARVGKIGPAMCINVAVYEALKFLASP